jgi:hypothetical protein
MTRDRQSPGMVDLDGWVALGAENLVRVQAWSGDVLRSAVGHGSNSEVGPKPEGGHHRFARTWCLRVEDREVVKTTRRELPNLYGARPEGCLREAGKPHERSARHSDVPPRARDTHYTLRRRGHLPVSNPTF